MNSTINWEKAGLAAAAVIFLFSLFLRFYALAEPSFFLFDEGYYLNFTYDKLTHPLALYPPKNLQEFAQALWALVRVALGTGKVFWFMLVDARAFFGATEMWSFPRFVSAVAGILTLIVNYAFVKRFYQSQRLAILSTVILSILPSHIFYSRLALQDAVSCLFFLLGFYFYFYHRRFGIPVFLSSLAFAFAYFSNYRLIFIPLLILLVEIYRCLISKEPNKIIESFRRYLWHTLIFFLAVFIVAGMDRGQNRDLIFPWMMYQAQLAKSPKEWMDFFSYPYYLFRLESVILGFLFFANIYFVIGKQWQKAFPFLFAILLMAIFSMTSDQGARYMCVGLPFVSLAAALLIDEFFQKKGKFAPGLSLAVVVVLILSFLPKAAGVALTHSDYKNSVDFLKTLEPRPKILSTQNWVQNLFTASRNDVKQAPYGYKRTAEGYLKGYHYLIIDPQAYICCTESKKRFDLPLKGALGLIESRQRPIKTFPHFSPLILERVVFEHNENLRQSIKFLAQNKDKQFGSLRIYALQDSMGLMMQAIQRQSAPRKVNKERFGDGLEDRGSGNED